jgi:hypothetical protein
MDPLAVIVDVSHSDDGADYVLGGGGDGVYLFDDGAETEAEVFIAEFKEATGMGVVVDSGFGFDGEAMHDGFGAAPLEEGFLDGLAVRAAADFTADLVIFEADLFAFVRGGGLIGGGGFARVGVVAHDASFGGVSSAPTHANTIFTLLISVEVRIWVRI